MTSTLQLAALALLEPDPVWALVLAVVALANLVAAAQVVADKRRAEHGRRRISERRLLLPIWLGGLAGLVLAMRWRRHKTSKRSFQAKLVLHVVLWGLAVAGVAWLLRDSL